MITVRLNAAYFPAVEMLSGVALALIVLYGGYQAIDGHITVGTIVAFVADAVVPVRTDPAALPALHDLPVRHGRPGEDLPAARRRSPTLAGPPRRERPRADPRRDQLRGRLLRLPPTRRAADAPAMRRRTAPEPVLALDHVDLRDPARPDGRAGRRHRRRQVDDGEARRALLRPDRGARAGRRPRPARGHEPLAALADGDRPAGGVPVLRHGRARTSPSGAPTPSDEQIRAAAAAVGADEFIAELPNGYDTEVGERGAQLSAGQRQLIAFARALIADPRILILDEATSNVDLHTEGRIEAGLRRLLAGRTSIVIAHRLSTIRQAGRIVVLEHGRIVEQGTHEELIAAERALLRAVPRLGRAGRGVAAQPPSSAPLGWWWV